MILRAVVDIDPDHPTIRELGELAFTFGLIDMTEVLLVSVDAMKANGQSAMFIITDDTYNKVVQTILACAILNFASWRFETFEIEVPAKTNERIALKLHRNYPPEHHKGLGDGYLTKAKEVIAKHQTSNNDNPV